VIVIQKQPSEKLTLAFEFLNKLPSGATLSSGSISAINKADSSDVTDTLLTSATMTIAGTQALFQVIGGTDSNKYQVTALVTLTNTDVLEEDAIIAVGGI
jgi:hypothetical protein